MATVAPAYLDEEINKHLASLSNLRAQKNSYLAVFRLPPDTLAKIFIDGARDYHESDDHIPFRTPNWVNVSDVALNCATLWTYHFIVSVRWTEELLARSKQASLKIRIHHDPWKAGPWWSDIMKELLRHLERVEELRLACVPPQLLPAISFRAPRLRILDFEGIKHPIKGT